MRILGRDKLTSFMRKHAQSRGPLKAWLAEAEKANWTKWADIKARYPSADLIGDGARSIGARSIGTRSKAARSKKAKSAAGHVVVFNIKANDFRLQVKVYFKHSMVIIERIGTHVQYNNQYNKWKL